MHVAGIGCRRGCPASDIVAAVSAAEHRAGTPADALAAPHFKQHEPGLLEAATLLALPLHLVDDTALAAAQPHCPTRSAAARAATGHASIAEAAAIATAGLPLLLPRLTHGQATCAMAGDSSPSPPGRGPG